MGRISVIKESDTGRNQRFIDNKTHKEMNRKEFVAFRYFMWVISMYLCMIL